jgi:hypothetical protein
MVGLCAEEDASFVARLRPGSKKSNEVELIPVFEALSTASTFSDYMFL